MQLCCWKCGGEQAVILPLSRRETCAACGADFHVCRLCVHYDPRVSDGCREERAERVSDPERANFCDYMQPQRVVVEARASREEEARAKLAELFGEPAENGSKAAGAQADDRDPGGKKPEASSADAAMEQLRQLFGDDSSSNTPDDKS